MSDVASNLYHISPPSQADQWATESEALLDALLGMPSYLFTAAELASLSYRKQKVRFGTSEEFEHRFRASLIELATKIVRTSGFDRLQSVMTVMGESA